MMKNLSLTFLILIGLGLSSCSSSEEDLAEGPDSSEEFVDDDEGFDEQEVVVDEQSVKEDEQLSDNEAEEAYEPQPEPQPQIASSGEMGTYRTQKGETLMQVAFKLYGDYRKWKDIMSLNNLSSQSIPNGMELKYEKSANPFVWSPSGNPYLIRNGDTLGTISQDKYNTSKRWKEIYNNNQPMIRDPNLIFAGFTIYYVPDSTREAASQK